MDLERVERELKKRWALPYRWGRKQSDLWDKETNFIYTTYSVASLIRKTEHLDEALRHYAWNRWYNFWSAMAIEDIFTSHPQVTANKNRYDKLVDFTIEHIPFDHKSSVFPRGFQKPYHYAKEHKMELIYWLYANQSQQGRKHLKNRLFIVLYDKDGEHWKMKAEIMHIKKHIDNYVHRFDKKQLHRIRLEQSEALSDIIWIDNVSPLHRTFRDIGEYRLG